MAFTVPRATICTLWPSQAGGRKRKSSTGVCFREPIRDGDYRLSLKRTKCSSVCLESIKVNGCWKWDFNSRRLLLMMNTACCCWNTIASTCGSLLLWALMLTDFCKLGYFVKKLTNWTQMVFSVMVFLKVAKEGDLLLVISFVKSKNKNNTVRQNFEQ